MKKILAIATLLAITPSFANKNLINTNKETQMTQAPKDKKSIYQFKVTDLYGEEFDFASLKGKKIMIVNTASECGLTPQYKQLQSMYNEFGGDNFVIVGFPANNFGSQEPGTNEEIATFCEQNYGVSFPMMNKISVKGKDIAPIYDFLTKKSKNGLEDSEVQWNFQKYLIDEEGHLVKVINPRTLPDDPEIKAWVKGK
ncbi:glutathione peroxidase [Myroides marinus]|uniref:glutathione peroxidase n=1 Tax=Myroides TaxID=76831 RepID=UPI000741DF55|nr:glutathione peroxidase [Myroides marinus]KUF43632.1 glutathione peroxidase [Myroides marinus]MDM1348912.1 glutathione peroxidase [Myroides marinus]MDM1349749.1 glutathione peroxidase [Myroides marinus]MDM1356958.1 glutathione peroxidase [Myroides marinus]MDM1364952.1 glutathione peroxidase [Myroides marinus]